MAYDHDATVTSSGIIFTMNLTRSCLAAATVLGVILIPSPAHAGLVQQDSLTSAHNSWAAKSVTIDCPGGTRVLGMGGWTNAGSGSVMLTGIEPDPAMRSVTASAHELPGFTGRWSVTVTVVCGPEALHPERVDSMGLSAATAVCPTSKILYASGFSLPDPAGMQYVDKVVPNQGMDRVSVHADSTDGSQVAVEAVGVCADDMPRWERTEATSPFNADSPKTVSAPRPDLHVDSGSWMFGSGALVRAPGHVFIDGLAPAAHQDLAWARASAANIQGPALMPGADPVQDEDGWEMDVHGTYIGSWH